MKLGEDNILTGGFLKAVLAPTEDADVVTGLPLVYVIVDGDRIVEFSPKEEALAGEKYPALGLEMAEVSKFAEIKRWPGGPVIELKQLDATRSLLGYRIEKVGAFDELEEGSVSAYRLELESGASLIVAHYSKLPMSVEVRVGASAT